MTIPTVRRPFSWYVKLIATGTAFSFVRYGDGEWYAIFGARGENCDGHRYFKELGRDLRRTLFRPHLLPSYHYGIVRVATRVMGPRIHGWLQAKDSAVKWHDGTTFKDAAAAGALFPLVEALRRRNVLLVGPERLGAVVDLFPLAGHVEVPLVDAYLGNGATKRAVLKAAKDCDLVAFSAGPGAKVAIYELFPDLGRTHALLDFGSLWDGLLGFPSRSYQRAKGWPELAAANRGER